MRPALSTIVLLVLSTCITSQTVKVRHVSDGDSLIIASGERVRMIGIDAPELIDSFGRESKEHLASLIRGKTVTLERDALNDDRDIHGRLLRFVNLNGVDINKQMIVDGYARAFLRYPFAGERRDAYRESEAAARAGRRGIWALSLDGNSHPIEAPPTAAPPESNRVAEPSPVWPKLCSGTVALFLLTTLGTTRHGRQRTSFTRNSHGDATGYKATA